MKLDNIETAGDRLSIAISKYFGTQALFADVIEVSKGNLSSYISGRYSITKNFAIKLQNLVGINSEYLLNGVEPIMLDKTRKPIKENVPLHISRTDTKTQHGITKQFILQDEGNQQILKPNGESSIVNLVLGILDDKSSPFQLLLMSDKFAKKYNINNNATLILKKDFVLDDLVLFSINSRRFEMGIFHNAEVKDLKSKQIYSVDEIEIIGRVVAKFENIRYNSKTGDIF